MVNGKLVMKPLKDSWKAGSASAGFRWGTVGFGSQFRPGDGKTVLAIGGTDSGIDTLTSGGVQGNVGAYVKGGFVGQSYAQWQGSKPAGSPWGYRYKASIAGGETKWSSNVERSSIVATQGDWKNDANGDVTFNASNPLKNVNGTDYSAYGTYIQKKLSEPLSKIQATGTVATGVASEGSIERHKYNYNDGNTVSYRFIYDDTSTTVDGSNNVTNNEKLITFTGDGVSAMQVFNIEGTALSSAGYRGVDFKFVNIPDEASVVINVDGSDIDFHTGWRFWWGIPKLVMASPGRQMLVCVSCTHPQPRRLCGTLRTPKKLPFAVVSRTKVRATTSSPRMILRPLCSAASSCRTAASNHT